MRQTAGCPGNQMQPERYKSGYLSTRVAFMLLATLVSLPVMGRAQCRVPDVEGSAVTSWANKVIAAIVGKEACYSDRSVFTNSDCNIFVGRVLEEVYKVNDFVSTNPQSGLRYEVSN